jgi:hypothetical protein
VTQPDQPQPVENGVFLAQAWERHRTHLFEGARPISDWLVEQIDPRRREKEPTKELVLCDHASPAPRGAMRLDRWGSRSAALTAARTSRFSGVN